MKWLDKFRYLFRDPYDVKGNQAEAKRLFSKTSHADAESFVRSQAQMRAKLSPDKAPLRVGDQVRKTKGYEWPGTVVSVFDTLSGQRRVVVECTVPEVAGALHIYNEGQLELAV